MKKILYPLIIFSVMLSACNYNSSIMLKTERNYKYSEIPKEENPQYRISPNDIIEFRIYSNDGFKMIDIISSAGDGRAMNTIQNGIQYLVEQDGQVKLPTIGRVKLAGFTLREAEMELEKLYSDYYIKPFVLLSVSNKRVIVFPGSPGDAKVIKLENNNTTLIEALALAGGISDIGKAKRIKIIRRNLPQPQVYLIDLSTIEGIKQADIILQANDIIYVEPTKFSRVSREVLRDVASILSILTSALIVYRFSRAL
jgi:polysaccharide export outer membrane protein